MLDLDTAEDLVEADLVEEGLEEEDFMAVEAMAADFTMVATADSALASHTSLGRAHTCVSRMEKWTPGSVAMSANLPHLRLYGT